MSESLFYIQFDPIFIIFIQFSLIFLLKLTNFVSIEDEIKFNFYIKIIIM